MSDNPVVIVFSCDDRYVQHTAAAIASVIHHSQRTFCFYILDCGISQKNVEKLQRWDLGSSTLTITAVAKNDVFERYRLHHKASPAIFGRLMVAEIFPQHDKMLYLDSDIIAFGDVGELWDINLGEMLMGGMNELPFLSEKMIFNRIRKNGSVGRVYFNSGVLLMNTKMMRIDHFGEACIRELEQNPNFIFPDQDAINRVIGENYVLLDPKFNFMIPLGSKKEFRDFRPILVHYTVRKPWVLYPWLLSFFGTYGQFAKSYWEAVCRTPFAKEAKQYVSFSKTARVLWKWLFQPIETFFRVRFGMLLRALWRR